MKATGIIVEYNPFHNGHIYHAKEARKITEADIVVAVMSGNFLQRGEPAFVDKWTRTKMALYGGVDLVFELPYAFATAHAPRFAQGAIQILDAALCRNFCFGSEEGNILPFENSLSLLQQASDAYEQNIQEAVRQGISYPKALNEAYNAILRSNYTKLHTVDLTKPNNILGFHYVQATHAVKSSMEAVTIPRIVAGYHDDAIAGKPIASATGIRKALFDSLTLHSVNDFIPRATKKELKKWQARHESYGSWTSFYPLLRFAILREGPERIAEIADITEGIENLIYRAARANATFDGFMNAVKSKRYTWTRLQRMLTHIFTGFTYENRQTIDEPSYLRLLGMTRTGQQYLNENKKRFELPLVSKASALSNKSLTQDIHATDMYALGIAYGNNQALIGTDFKTAPIIIQN